MLHVRLRLPVVSLALLLKDPQVVSILWLHIASHEVHDLLQGVLEPELLLCLHLALEVHYCFLTELEVDVLCDIIPKQLLQQPGVLRKSVDVDTAVLLARTHIRQCLQLLLIRQHKGLESDSGIVHQPRLSPLAACRDHTGRELSTRPAGKLQ